MNTKPWEHNAYNANAKAVLGASIYIDLHLKKMNVVASLLLEVVGG